MRLPWQSGVEPPSGWSLGSCPPVALWVCSGWTLNWGGGVWRIALLQSNPAVLFSKLRVRFQPPPFSPP